MEHPSEEVQEAFRRLQNALVSWERGTGCDSLLIFREARGHFSERGRMPSEVVIRLQNGISIDPACADLCDCYLLDQFTDGGSNSPLSSTAIRMASTTNPYSKTVRLSAKRLGS